MDNLVIWIGEAPVRCMVIGLFSCSPVMVRDIFIDDEDNM